MATDRLGGAQVPSEIPPWAGSAGLVLPPSGIRTDIHLKPEWARFTASPDLHGCVYCDTPGSMQHTLFACGGCRLVKYCNKECQRGDWRRHKPKCGYHQKTYFAGRLKDNYEVFLGLSEVGDSRVDPLALEPIDRFPWTRECWDACRELYWYYCNNQTFPYTAVHPINSQRFPHFYDYATYIFAKANAGITVSDGKVVFVNDYPDAEYLEAEQEKEKALCTCRALPAGIIVFHEPGTAQPNTFDDELIVEDVD